MRKIDVRNFQRATRDTSREINRRIILNLLREKGPVSRAELARSMEVPRGMITSLVNELLEEELVFEGATADAPRGRRPRLLHLRSHDRLALAVDVGTGQTRVRLSDFGGRTLGDECFSTPAGPDELVRMIVERCSRLWERKGGVGELEGIGVVVPGMVDNRAGRVLNVPTLGWRDVALRDALAARLSHPVWVDRDAVACAMATMWLRPSVEDAARNFLYLIVSEGVGTGVVVNGQVVRGRHYTAGEFGHVLVAPDGPVCSCGSRGCLEAFTSNPATVRRYREAGRGGREGGPAGGAGGDLSVGEVIRRARGGDERALGALRTTGRYLGLGVAGMINALDPARIIVGGDIVEGWPLIREVVLDQVRERTLTPAAAATTVETDPGHAETRIRGAVALVVAPAFAAPRVA